MNSEVQKVSRPRFTVIEAFLVLVISFLFFRFTVALMLVVLALLYLFFPLHGSRRTLLVASVLFALAVLIPADIYVPGYGSLMHSEHSGLRFVRVIYGLGAHRRDGGEFISGSCIVGVHDTRWRLVWD